MEALNCVLKCTLVLFILLLFGVNKTVRATHMFFVSNFFQSFVFDRKFISWKLHLPMSGFISDILSGCFPIFHIPWINATVTAYWKQWSCWRNYPWSTTSEAYFITLVMSSINMVKHKIAIYDRFFQTFLIPIQYLIKISSMILFVA